MREIQVKPAITSADLGPLTQSGNRMKVLAVADGATLSVQVGTATKHIHANSNPRYKP